MNHKKLKNTHTLFVNYVCFAFKIVGLAPINYQANNSLFVTSKLNAVYNLLLICSIISLYCSTSSLLLSKISVKELFQLDRILDSFHAMSAGAAAVYLLSYFSVQRQKCAEICNIIKDISESVTKLDIRVHDYSKELRIRLIRIFLTYVLVWIPVVASISISEIDAALCYSFMLLCNIIISCTFAQYSINLTVIRQILITINAHFHNISKNTSRSLRVDAIQCGVNFDQQIKRKHFWRLREMYFSLCEISDRVSQFYSQPMLLCLSYVFVTFIFLSHILMKPLVLGRCSGSAILICHCVFRILQYVVELIILTRAVTAITLECKLTGKIVNKWLGNSDNEFVGAKLYHFSNYLLHHNPQFSVFGLFSLEESLLMSIVGSITTYLVIFLQFQASSSNELKHQPKHH